MLKTVVGLSEVGNYLRHLGSFLHRYAWASTSRSPSIGPFEASSLIFQELYLRTVSKRNGSVEPLSSFCPFGLPCACRASGLVQQVFSVGCTRRETNTVRRSEDQRLWTL